MPLATVIVTQSHRRHPVKLPSSIISDNFAYRRFKANVSDIIVQKRVKERACCFEVSCTMPPCLPVAAPAPS